MEVPAARLDGPSGAPLEIPTPRRYNAGSKAGAPPVGIELNDANSPAHIPIASQPAPCALPDSKGRSSRLLPGRQRILASAARQLAASESLVEGLDLCAVDIDTHSLPPPASLPSPQQPQDDPPPSPRHRKQALELLRLNALLQAAVGAEEDLVIVGLHQVGTQHRHAWAACIAAAFSAAEGEAATAIRMHLLGPDGSVAGGGSGAAARRTTSLTHYEQIVPLDACPHHNQLLLVYVHPGHLSKVTLLSIAKSRLGSYCCHELQQNYKFQWGLSIAAEEELRKQLELRKKQEQQHRQQQQQYRMDVFFNFNNIFGLSEYTAVGATTSEAADPAAELPATEGTTSVTGDGEQAERARERCLEPPSLSSWDLRQQQRGQQQRRADGICHSRTCPTRARDSCRPSEEAVGNTTGSISSSGHVAACGCEFFREVFAYGGMAARVLIGATPVVFACVDLKQTEEALEPCDEVPACLSGPSRGQVEGVSVQAAAGAAGRASPRESCGGASAEDNEGAVAWRKFVIRALQRQQLLAVLSDLRFETDSGWASALELKPLLLLGACQQGWLQTGGSPYSFDTESHSGPHSAAAERQQRLRELEQLGISTADDARFFFCRIPEKAGSQVLSFGESGRAAEWRRPAWRRRCSDEFKHREGVIARFCLRWMSCRLLVETVDAERVKKECNELRKILKFVRILLVQQEGRCLSKLLVDPPLLQLPPVRPFEPMELKISLSNPHETLPTAYAVYCLADSGRSIVPLSQVSYWHGALWRKWEGRTWEGQSLISANSRESEIQTTPDAQPLLDHEQQQLVERERQRLCEETLRETSGQGATTPRAAPLATSKTEAASKKTDADAVLRKRIRLERWLLMDSLHGFLRGGETRVVSMILNIQEGIYSAHEFACGVLVLRLVDSRQDFFCCLASSLMPALLGAELQPLAMLGRRNLLGPSDTSEEEHTQGKDHSSHLDALTEVNVPSLGVDGAEAPVQSAETEASTESTSLLPLPKELWWLLMHLHTKAKTVFATAARESPQWRDNHRQRCQWKYHQNEQQEEGHSEVYQLCSEGKSSCAGINNEDNNLSDSFFSGSSLCKKHEKQLLDVEGTVCTEGWLAADIAEFLCITGGETLKWPSFLAGADTYLQPQRGVPVAQRAENGADNLTRSNPCGNTRQRRQKKPGDSEATNRNAADDTTSCSVSHDEPTKREVFFLRACLERGIEIPQGVSICAALALLEEWGATCCFFPSEFAVQDVQTDNLHLLCRAILLSLPAVHRNAFISIISALNELLRAAAYSRISHGVAPRREAPIEQQHSPEGSSFTSGAEQTARPSAAPKSAEKLAGCCPTDVRTATAACVQLCTGAVISGIRGGSAQRVACLESEDTSQLFRQALLLWTGSWLMKSCRPVLRHAVLDHFIAPI